MTYCLEQHIEELRAEFRNVIDADERGEIAAELELAQAEMMVAVAEQQGILDAEPPF
ncbi:hypothetical protein ACSV9I_21345 [Rhizobium sp. G187]|uniref:hypothetical protein n=1 Tax=Rhizobium sp. G187 TaxID=3451352 RepID=UPI003EE6E9BF